MDRMLQGFHGGRAWDCLKRLGSVYYKKKWTELVQKPSYVSHSNGNKNMQAGETSHFVGMVQMDQDWYPHTVQKSMDEKVAGIALASVADLH